MPEFSSRLILPISVVAGGLLIFYRVVAGSTSGNGYQYLAGLVGLEFLVLVLWKYEERFLPLLFFIFLLAGAHVPLHGVWLAARWGVLGVGAIVGFALYMRIPTHRFGAFHLTASFAIVFALISALVSSYPKVAVLKALSLFLVFLYGAGGARLAIVGREVKFCYGLLLACEVLVYISSVSYFMFRFPLYGNPNSLGVVAGVVLFPVLLWGAVVSEDTKVYKRQIFALLLCILLLFSSYARASLGAACISSLFVTLSLRRYRLLLKGAALAFAAALLIMVIVPSREASSRGGVAERLTNAFFYKGTRAQGFFDSRQTPWQLTAAAIHDHPWFGTGFGTSITAIEGQQDLQNVTSGRAATREHGNSYLAILEWTGLLGVEPFYLLVILLAIGVGRTAVWMRRTGNPFSPAVPIAALLAGAIFHATFEDWMFAVGYYMCVFFWTFSFAFFDVLPSASAQPLSNEASILVPLHAVPYPDHAVALGR